MKYFILATGLLTACGVEVEPYEPIVICHNSNCVEPPAPEEDDTLASLLSSLKLKDSKNRPYHDGVEMDFFWRGSDDACVYAHDLGQEKIDGAMVPVDAVIQWLQNQDADGFRRTRASGKFHIFVELKGHVGEKKSEKHSPAQREAHASCAVDVLDKLKAAGEEDVILHFTSFDPALLAEVDKSLSQRGYGDSSSVQLGALLGVSSPLDSQSRPIAEFGDEVDFLSAHPQWLTVTSRQAAFSRGWELGYWFFSSVPETYERIRTHRPKYITTSEAKVLHRWLETQNQLVTKKTP